MIENIHDFTIETMAITQDSTGGVVRTWSETGKFSGRAIVMSEKEKVSYGIRSERAVWKILSDANPNVTEQNRIKFDYGEGIPRTLRVLRSSYPRSANLSFFKTVCDEDETTS